MSKKSIKLNYIFNVCYQILLIIIPLITTPYISRIFNADGIGEISFAESIVSYFSLFAMMGIGTYGKREISYVQEDKNKRSEVFWNTFFLKFFTSTIIFAIYLFLYFFIFKTKIYLVLSISIISVLFDITWFYQGIEEFKLIVIRNMILKIIALILIFIIIKNKSDLYLYVFINVFFVLLGNLSLWTNLKNYINKPVVKDLHPLNGMFVAFTLFIPTIAIQIYTVLDKTMIGLITDSYFENGYYELSAKISKTVLPIITSLGTVVVPRIGDYFGKNDKENIRKLMYKSYRFVLLLGLPLCVGLMLVSDNFVPWFFGDGYSEVSRLIKVLSLLIIAIGISNVTGIQLLIPTKRQNLYTFTIISGAVINFILNLFLISKIASLGAAIASVIAEMSITFLQLYIVRKEISIFVILNNAKNYIISTFLMGAFLFIIKGQFDASIINSGLLVIIGATVYFIVLYLLEDEYFIQNLNTLYERFNSYKEGSFVMKILEKIFSREYYFYASFFYVTLKNLFVMNTRFLTYGFMFYGLLILLYDFVFNREIIKYKTTKVSLVLLIPFILPIFVLRVFNSENVAITIDMIISLFLYFNCFYKKDNNEIKRIFKNFCYMLLVFSVIWGLFGIVLIVTKINIDFFGVIFGLQSSGRLELARPSINPTGFLAMSVIGCNLFLLYNTDSLRFKYFIIFDIVLMFIIIFFTQSMGTFLAMFTGMFWLLIVFSIKSGKFLKYFLFFVIFICIFSIISILILLLTNVKSRVLDFGFVSFIVRYDLIKYAILVLFYTHPIIGESYGMMKQDWVSLFDTITSKYNFDKQFISEYSSIVNAATHNTQMSYIGSAGIVGAIALIIFYIFVILILVKYLKKLTSLDEFELNMFIPLSFIIVITFAMSLTGVVMFVSITDYANVLFFTSMAALIQINENNKNFLDVKL